MQRKQKQKAGKDILRLLFSGFGVNLFWISHCNTLPPVL